MHYRKIVSILVVTLCTVGVFGCKSKSADGTKETAKDSGKVLVEVNGTKITADSFKKEIDALPPYLKPMTDTPEGKRELLDTMIVRELIMQQAKKDGIDNSKAVADKLEDLKKRVVVEAFLNKKVEDQVKLGDAELQDFYNKNKDKFKSGDQIKASHILVKTEPEAQEMVKMLKSGTSFEELAQKYSMDAAKTKGGDLGWFGKGAMLPEFESAAFGLKEGQVSGIVKTKFGFHLIKLTGKRPAGIRPFEEVKEQIKAALLPEKQQAVFKQLKDDLKKEAKITFADESMKAPAAKPVQAPAAMPTEKK